MKTHNIRANNYAYRQNFGVKGKKVALGVYELVKDGIFYQMSGGNLISTAGLKTGSDLMERTGFTIAERILKEGSVLQKVCKAVSENPYNTTRLYM